MDIARNGSSLSTLSGSIWNLEVGFFVGEAKPADSEKTSE